MQLIDSKYWWTFSIRGCLAVVFGINGLLSILFNVIIYIQAEVTKEPIAWILSIYLVVYGLLMIIFGAKLKASKEG